MKVASRASRSPLLLLLLGLFLLGLLLLGLFLLGFLFLVVVLLRLVLVLLSVLVDLDADLLVVAAVEEAVGV